MVVWIVFLVLQLLLALTALAASYSARRLAGFGCYARAEAAGTISFCLFVVLGVIFICTISSALTAIGLALTAVWVFMAWRERRFIEYLPA